MSAPPVPKCSPVCIGPSSSQPVPAVQHGLPVPGSLRISRKSQSDTPQIHLFSFRRISAHTLTQQESLAFLRHLSNCAQAIACQNSVTCQMLSLFFPFLLGVS